MFQSSVKLTEAGSLTIRIFFRQVNPEMMWLSEIHCCWFIVSVNQVIADFKTAP